MKRSLSVCFCILLLVSHVMADGFGQLDSLLQNAIQFSQKRMRGAYLHLITQIYYLGKLWFKAYVISGQRELILLSKVLYVRLLNQSDNL